MSTNDLSGISGPRLGLGHSSGWSHLSAPTSGDRMSGLDFDKIAAEAASEAFGARAGHPFVRAAYHAGRVSAGAPAFRRPGRDYYRAGWGSPGWQAEAGGGYADPGSEFVEDPAAEEQELAEEAEALADDGGGEEYGDEEFGIFGRKRRRARRQRRREHRRATHGAPGWSAESMDAERAPLGYEEEEGFEFGGYDPSHWHGRRGGPVVVAEEGYGGYDPSHWHGRRGGPVVVAEEGYGGYAPARWHGRRGGPVVAAEESYGEGPVAAPSQKSSFRNSVETGLGVGLGFLGAVAAVTLVARAFGGRR